MYLYVMVVIYCLCSDGYGNQWITAVLVYKRERSCFLSTFEYLVMGYFRKFVVFWILSYWHDFFEFRSSHCKHFCYSFRIAFCAFLCYRGSRKVYFSCMKWHFNALNLTLLLPNCFSTMLIASIFSFVVFVKKMQYMSYSFFFLFSSCETVSVQFI